MNLRCHFCRHELDPRTQTVWRQVTGWERKANTATRNGCIDSVKSGVGPRQESLI